MRYLYILSIVLIYSFQSSAQCYTTEWLNPNPVGNPLLDVFSISEDTVIAVGERGTIIKTNNGGQSWIDLTLAETYNLNSVYFVNNDTGFTAGVINNHSVIYKTIDGGNNWSLVFDGYQVSLYGFVKNIQFTSNDTGYAYFGTSRILYTYNGGNNWNVRSASPAGSDGGLFFVNNNKGFLTTSGASMARTLDAGQTFQSIPIIGNMGSDRVKNIHFPDSMNGYGITSNTKLVITRDGGATWTYKDNTGLPWFGHDIYFTSVDTGFVIVHSIDWYNHVFRTIDSGNTWQLLTLPTTYSSDDNAISFSGSTGYVVSDLANIFKTTDFGGSWIDLSSGTRSFLYAIESAGVNNIFAAGSREILKSIDKGNTWNQVFSMSSGSFYGMHFIDSLKGWAVGSNGSFRKTINGGQTWTGTSTSLGSGVYYTVYFKSADTGFIGGPGLRRSVNGGQTWTGISLGSSSTIRAIDFSGSNIGFAVGANGAIFRTIDGGSTWTALNSNTTKYLLAVQVLNDSTAIVGGEDGYVFRTTDTGNTWVQTTPGWGDNIQSLYFKNEMEGYMIQSDFNGIIYHTNNGGLNWILTAVPTNAYLWDLAMLEDDLYISGANGWLLKLSSEISAPTIANVSRCDSGSVTLNAISPYTVRWYDGPGNQATLIDTGTTITLNILQTQTLYTEAFDASLNCISQRIPVTITIDQPTSFSASITVSKDTICTGETVLFTALGNANNIIDYQWFVNGIIKGNKTDTFSVSNLTSTDSVWTVIKSDDYCLTDSFATSPAVQVFVATPPSPGISTVNYSNCLKSNAFQFTDSSNYFGNQSFPLWKISDSTTYTNQVFQKTFAQAGDYEIQLIAENNFGCMDSIKTFVSVFPDPKASLSVDDAEQCFKDNLFVFTDNSSIDSGFTVTSLWNFGDATTSNTSIANKSYTSFNNNYTVTLISTSNTNCKDTASIDVELFESPVTSAISGDTIVEKNSIISYSVQPNLNSIFSWHIEKGTGSGTANTINIQWNEVGTGLITVVEQDVNGCVGDTVQLEVLVTPSVGIAEKVTFFNVFPVPAKEILNISIDLKPDLKGKLFNALGQEVMIFDIQSSLTTIETAALSQGIYQILILQDNKVIASKKVVLVK